MDGTMIDSNPIVEVTWGEFCDRHGFDLAELLRFSHGRLTLDTVRHYLPGESLESARAMVADMLAKEMTMNDKVLPIAGASELLRRATEVGLPWALVTSATHDLAKIRFHYAQLPWPNVVVTAENVTAGKPSPEGYLAAAAQLGIAAEDCVVFEDAAPGVAAGLAAGAEVIVVGADASELTAPLPRVPDLRGVSVEPSERSGWFALSY